MRKSSALTEEDNVKTFSVDQAFLFEYKMYSVLATGAGSAVAGDLGGDCGVETVFSRTNGFPEW